MKDADAKVVTIVALSKQIRKGDYPDGVEPEKRFECQIEDHLLKADFAWTAEVFESYIIEDPDADVTHIQLEPQDVEDLVALLSRPYIDEFSSDEWLEVARRLPKIRTKLRRILGC